MKGKDCQFVFFKYELSPLYHLYYFIQPEIGKTPSLVLKQDSQSFPSKREKVIFGEAEPLL